MARSREEILKEIEEVKEKDFMNQMDDHWSDWNYRLDRQLHEKRAELEKELKDLEA